MNLTLALDDELLRDAREAARTMGKSLNQVVREYLEHLTGCDQPQEDIDELRRLSAEGQGRSRVWRFDRDELHERP